jgi:hypothetical protein
LLNADTDISSDGSLEEYIVGIDSAAEVVQKKLSVGWIGVSKMGAPMIRNPLVQGRHGRRHRS